MHNRWLLWWVSFPLGGVLAAWLWRSEIERNQWLQLDWMRAFHWAVPAGVAFFLLTALLQLQLEPRAAIRLGLSLLGLAVVGYVLAAYGAYTMRHFAAFLPRPLLAAVQIWLHPFLAWSLLLVFPVFIASLLAAFERLPSLPAIASSLALWGVAWAFTLNEHVHVVLFYGALALLMMPKTSVLIAPVTALGLALAVFLTPQSTSVLPPDDVFDAYLASDIPPAEGFDLPRKSGDILAVATGRVLSTAPLVIEHMVYENHAKLRVQSRYADLDAIVVQGDPVLRGQRIGKSQRLRFSFSESDAWLAAHATIALPHHEPLLAVVDSQSKRMRLYAHAKALHTYEVAFGQAHGQKRRRDDLKTPRGMYFVTQRTRGPFEGEYGGYYGGYWIKFDYPNAFDAEWGEDQSLLTRAQARRIRTQWSERALTQQDSELGGGIGFHSWIEEWPNDGPRTLSWGCVVLHPSDVAEIYDALLPGAMVVIL